MLAATPAYAIPRDVVVARAMVWANVVRSRDASGQPTAYGVPYSQKRWAKANGALIPTTVGAANARYLGWRTDCSGFVAMCWDLRDALGRPQSPTTMDYRANPSRWYKITKADLKPGDMMLVCAEWGAPYSHAVLFTGWVDAAKTQYWAVEESSSKRGVVRRMTPYPYWGSAGAYYRPYRYASIQDDFADVITNVSGVTPREWRPSPRAMSFPASDDRHSIDGLVVASSQQWAETLSAASLAAGLRGPVLLTPAHSLATSTAAEIKRLRPRLSTCWARRQPSTTRSRPSSRPGTKVVRVGGYDRYVMASIVRREASGSPKAEGTKVDTAYLVNGVDFPDAYAAAPSRSRRRGRSCAPRQRSCRPRPPALSQMRIRNVVIVGSRSSSVLPSRPA